MQLSLIEDKDNMIKLVQLVQLIVQFIEDKDLFKTSITHVKKQLLP